MRAPRRDSGRGRLALALLLLLVAVAGVAGWRFTHPEPAGPTVSLSAAAAESGRQKVDRLADAGAEADRSGRPVPVSQTFTDSELSSLASDEARARGLPFERVLLHATGSGTIQGQATAYAGGQHFPVSFEVVPEATDDSIHVRVTRLSVAALPLPGPVGGQMVGQLQQLLDVQQAVVPLHQLSVRTSEGRVTVSGVAAPG